MISFILKYFNDIVGRRAERRVPNLPAAKAMTLPTPFGPIFDQPYLDELIATGQILDQDVVDAEVEDILESAL